MVSFAESNQSDNKGPAEKWPLNPLLNSSAETIFAISLISNDYCSIDNCCQQAAIPYLGVKDRQMMGNRFLEK